MTSLAALESSIAAVVTTALEQQRIVGPRARVTGPLGMAAAYRALVS